MCFNLFTALLTQGPTGRQHSGRIALTCCYTQLERSMIHHNTELKRKNIRLTQPSSLVPCGVYIFSMNNHISIRDLLCGRQING
jgi:hypothetical protein